MKRRLILLILLLGLIGGMSAVSQAQQPIITVNVPFFWEMLIDEAVVAQFETEHGVDVRFIYGDSNIEMPADAEGVEDYLAAMTDYTSSADVLYVSPNNLTPEATRAGFFIDLMPLVTADAQLNPSDFHPALWESYQWDNSMWALPTSAQTVLVDYIPELFDEAGLAYPDANWTLDDYVNAARELTQYNDDGSVAVPGMMVGDGDALVRSLFGSDYINSGTSPSDPSLTSPDLALIFETWLEMLNESIAVNFADIELLNQVPIRIGSGDLTFMAVRAGGDDEEDGSEDTGPRGNFFDAGPDRNLAPMPGNTGGLQVNGFAVSSGSNQPQLAYELVRYLTEQQVIANAVPGAEPARYTYSTPAELPTEGPVVVFGGTIERSPEDEALVQYILDNGLNVADLRYSHYLDNVISYVNEGLTVDDALQSAEVDALAIMAAIDNATPQFAVIHATAPVLAEGEIALNFGLESFIRPLPNEDEWNALIAEFVAQDPQVGAVSVNLGFPQELLADNDCAYLAMNAIEDLDSEGLLALDPLVSTDANYDLNSVPASALESMRVNGMLYGLPMTLTPDVLNYNPTIFANAGLAEPLDGWTMDEFIDALQQIKPILPTDEFPFVSQSFGSTYILLLIAAQGGVPLDFSTDPITVDFTSPENIAAIQAVLDLAKAGYIDYQGLGQFGGGRGVFIIEDDNIPAIVAASFLGGRGGQRRQNQNANATEAITTTYPTGTTYTPVSYQVGGGFINVDTAYPEACYRWLSFLANHPHVLNAMPALLSTLTQPELTDALGADTVSAYQNFAELLNASNVVNLSTTDFFAAQWLNSAFDAYVLEDADLLTALQDAQQKTNDYLTCAAQVPEDADFEAYLTCVENVG
jgi:ABC-type glycerol-3-phosphate transport system substrate-binding protein